jgi:hypothetical protein
VRSSIPDSVDSRPETVSLDRQRGARTHHLREHNVDTTTAPSSTDEKAVHDLYQQLMDAWSQGSGAAFA